MSSQSILQWEARTTGEQKGTIKYLTQNHLVAIVIFTGVIVIGTLWAGTYIAFLRKYIFRGEEMSPLQWLLVALITTFILWFLIRYVFRVPITAAFSL